jgi:hypothetical protein
MERSSQVEVVGMRETHVMGLLLCWACACSGTPDTAPTIAGVGGSGPVCTPGAPNPCLGPGQCQGTQQCNAQGTGYGACDCSAGGTGGAGGAPAGATGGGPTSIAPGCNGQFAAYAMPVPTVVWLLDRSGSMFDTAYGSYPNRWQPAKDTLIGDGTSSFGVIGDYQASMRFGFGAFTNQADKPGQCPIVTGAGNPLALNNRGLIESLYDLASSDPIDDGGGKGETPTGDAVDTIAATLVTFTEPGARTIVLVTDGQPDTCTLLDPQCGQDHAIRAVQDAHQAGIDTLVVGIEMTGADDTRYLTQLANAGAGQPVQQGDVYPDCADQLAQLPGGGNSASYSATMGTAAPALPADAAALQTALVRLVQGLRSCVVDLSGVTVNTSLASQGAVELEGQVLVYGDTDGWQMQSATTLELRGAACEALRAAPEPHLYASFPCGALL